MLKLYHVTYYCIKNPVEIFSRFVLAKSPCHALNLLYREFDMQHHLNDYRHSICEEVPCINPSKFSKNGKSI